MAPYRIGTAGWSVPARTQGERSHLEHYASLFNCAEINSTFYRAHKPQTWSRWFRETPSDFRFSVKAPKTITHEAKLRNIEQPLRSFLDQLTPIQPKLGPLLFQLPPSLAFEISLAEDFLDTLRRLYAGEAALEPRHASWFTAKADLLLKSRQVARVAADPAKTGPEAAEPGGDTRLVYYRLHGSPRMYYGNYEDACLTSLAAHVRQHSNAWIIFDNTAAGHAFPNALLFRDLI